MIPTPVKTRRQFDESFKGEALHNWLSSGKSAAVIGRELVLGSVLALAVLVALQTVNNAVFDSLLGR
jgi:hypothetical protein